MPAWGGRADKKLAPAAKIPPNTCPHFIIIMFCYLMSWSSGFCRGRDGTLIRIEEKSSNIGTALCKKPDLDGIKCTWGLGPFPILPERLCDFISSHVGAFVCNRRLTLRRKKPHLNAAPCRIQSRGVRITHISKLHEPPNGKRTCLIYLMINVQLYF